MEKNISAKSENNLPPACASIVNKKTILAIETPLVVNILTYVQKYNIFA